MVKNSIINKITPCCGLPFSVAYWWVSNLTLTTEEEREYILSKISHGGTISIDAWKTLINAGTLDPDASLSKNDFLEWFDYGQQPTCARLKIIINSFEIGAWTPETELPLNIALIDMIVNGENLSGNVYTKQQVNALITGSFGGKLMISDVPAPVGRVWYFAGESGTYVNAGNQIVNISGKMVVLIHDAGEWSQIEIAAVEGRGITSVTLSGSVGDVDTYQILYSDGTSSSFQVKNGADGTSIDEVNESLAAMGLLEAVVSNISQIKPAPFTKYTTNDQLDNRSYFGWFVGVSKKKINRISVPITSRYNGSVPLTDGVYFRLAINGNYFTTKTISLSDLESQGIDTQSGLEEDSMYEIEVSEFTINQGDIIFVGVTCISPTDKLGFVATNILNEEWSNGYIYYGSVNVMDYADTAILPGNSPFAYNIYFSHYTQEYIKKPDTVPVVAKQYLNIDLARQNIGVFLSKLRKGEDVTVVCYGDSIVQFQDSETLSVADQKINPIGLSGNSWVRQLWQMLQYKGADVQYRRFDHADFTFSNGIQTTAAAIGSNGWASARNDAEPFRMVDFNGVYPQSIISGFSYNKPAVVTNKAGEFFSIQIPSFATELQIILTASAGTVINVEISGEPLDAVTLDPNLNTPSEYSLKYNFPAGSPKTLKVSTVNASMLAVWGVVYKAKPSVRVVNSGQGGYNVNLLRDQWRTDRQVKWYKPDLIVCEVASSNDANLSGVSLNDHAEYVEEMFLRLEETGAPVLVLLTHRFETQKISRVETSEADQESVKFIPELIKNYRASAFDRGFAIIDIFSKSVDILGQTNTVTLPPGFYVDSGHLGVLGNKMYVDELEKLFIIEDFE